MRKRGQRLEKKLAKMEDELVIWLLESFGTLLTIT